MELFGGGGCRALSVIIGRAALWLSDVLLRREGAWKGFKRVYRIASCKLLTSASDDELVSPDEMSQSWGFGAYVQGSRDESESLSSTTSKGQSFTAIFEGPASLPCESSSEESTSLEDSLLGKHDRTCKASFRLCA